MLRKTRLTTVLISTGLTSALLVGCGDDTSGSDNPSATTSVDTAAAPTELTWSRWQGVQLPTSRVDGPRNVDGDVVSGYTNSPQGAVLAAVHGSIRLALSPDTSWPKVANAVAAPGVGRDTYAVNRALISIAAVPAGPAPMAVKGFRVDEYSPTRSVISVAVAQPNLPLTAAKQTVVWSGEDWKVLLPAPGSEVEPTTVSDLTGYTALEGPQ